MMSQVAGALILLALCLAVPIVESTRLVSPHGLVSGGKTLKVGCFHFPPFTIVKEDGNGTLSYSGVEVSLVRVVAKSLGLEPEFHSPSDGKAWGFIYENGSSDGLLRDVIEGVVDVGMAEYFYYPKRTRVSHASDFYTLEHFCFVRRKPRPIPQWQALIRPFGLRVWLAVLASLAATILFLCSHNKLKSFPRLPERDVILSSLGFYIGQSLSWSQRRLQQRSTKILFATTSVLGAIISISYSGTLVSFLTVSTYPKLEHSIESLLDFPGHFGTVVFGNDYGIMIEHPNAKIRQLARTKYRASGTIENSWKMVGDGNYAYLNSKISSEYVIKTQFTDRFGRSDYYVMNQCWNSFLVVLYFPLSHGGLKRAFDARIQQLRESGMIIKWMEDELGRADNGVRSEAASDKLSLEKHLRGILMGLGICLGICVATAGAEILSHWRNMRSQDKDERHTRVSPFNGSATRSFQTSYGIW